MHYKSLVISLLWLMPWAVFAQENQLNPFSAKLDLQIADKAALGTPPALSGSLTEALDHAFDSIVSLSPIKGFNAAVLLPDGTTWKRAAGIAEELPAQQPLTTEHLMGMGSITKTFVSATLLLLYEEGLVGLDDSIGTYVGPYPNVPGEVTIGQMLSHRSGISDYGNENPAMVDAWLANLDSIWAIDTILTHYVLTPNFPPGTSWSYSNTNYLLAARIIETLAGQPWYMVVRQKLLDPLGLTHTFAYPFETPGSQPFSHVFADIDGDGAVDDVQGSGIPLEGYFSISSGDGGLVSTPEDLVKFCEKLFGGNVLAPATLAEMQTDYLQDGSNVQYGLGALGVILPLQGLQIWGHDGDVIYKSLSYYLPSENIAIAVQQNDDRIFDPAEPSPVFDKDFLFLALLNAYLNYSPPSAVNNSLTAEATFYAFPNPASASFRLNFEGKHAPDFPQSLTLTDLTGRVVLTQIIENEKVEISLANIPTGIYGWKIGRLSGKLVVGRQW